MKRLAILTFAAGMAVAAHSAAAADLGSLRVLSASGEPLRAEIAVESLASQQEADTLKAGLAERGVYAQTKLDYKAALSQIKLAVENHDDGRKVVAVSSDTALDVRVLDLLVELTWNQGRFIRQYTFFLSPPDASAAAPVADTVKIEAGDTLSGIAGSIQPEGATLEQAMAALVHANPKAFIDGNMNLLKAGAVLTLPKAEAVTAEDAAQARALVAEQRTAFESYRQRVAGGAGRALKEGGGKQASSGQIAKPAAQPPAAPGGGDALKLSSAGDQKAADQGEARDAAGKAVQDASDRVKEVQGNVEAMRGLLEAQNTTGAQAQQQAEQAKPAADDAEAKPDFSMMVLGAVVAVLAAVIVALILRRRAEKQDGAAPLEDEAKAEAETPVAPVVPIASAAPAKVNNLSDWDDIPPFPVPDKLPVPDKPPVAGRPALVDEEARQAMTARLDMAKSYADVGDRAGAREMLEEIIKTGNPEQRARAEAILATL